MGDIFLRPIKQQPKSQAKPLFTLLVCIVILSSAVFAESYANSTNGTAGTLFLQITKIIGLFFSNHSITAMLVLENDTPIPNQELRFFENGSALSSSITNESGIASIDYNSTGGEHNISVVFGGSENFAPSDLSGTIIINNGDNETLYNETINISQPQTAIGEIVEIFFSKLSALRGEIMTIGARLTYDNSTPVPGEVLGFFENSAYIGSNITDENGTAVLSYNTSASAIGNATINVTHGAFWNASAFEIAAPQERAQENSTNETNATANFSANTTIDLNATENISANITTGLNEANITVEESNITQGIAEIGKPVVWTKKIVVKNNAQANGTPVINLSLDTNAENISVEEANEGKEMLLKQKKGRGTGAASVKNDFEFKDTIAPNEEKEYAITYSTPAPEKKEGENRTENAEWKKKVTVFSDYSYKNVSSYTEISEAAIPQIRLFWNVGGAPVDVTQDPAINLTYVDSNSNGKIDRIYWTVPHLSEQEFIVVVSLTIINVQSYPTVGGTWTVRFNTTGTANLTISAIDGTTWSNETEEKDLKFLELVCGADSIASEWINDSVFIENYSCNSTGYETSKVLTSGKHRLMFEFGDDVDYANNLAGCSITCDSASNNVCIISSAKEVLADCYIDDNVLGGNTSIQINSGGSIYNNTNNASFAINVTGNVTIKSGGNISGNVNITAANLTIESGGTIDASGKGYPGIYEASGSGPGTGSGSSEISYSGGGAHGGNGGRGYSGGLAGGSAYDSLLNPADFGSSGGGVWHTTGGSGGGLIRLNIADLVVNGSIVAGGNSGYGPGYPNLPGGGAGGSVYINTSVFSGGGSISANGAAGGGSNYGGGGGGGLIAVYYANSTFNGSFSAFGGGSAAAGQYGGAGTIYLKQSSQTYGNLTIANNGNAGANTPLNSSAYQAAFGIMNISNGANITSALSTLSLNATKLVGNGKLSLGANNLTLRVSNISMSGENILSTTGRLNITFANSINTSNFNASISTSSGAITFFYGSGSTDRCDISGAAVSGTTLYYYAPWSNTSAYRCVRSIVIDNYGLIDNSNTSRTQLNVNEAFYSSVRIREYNGTDYFDVDGSWNMVIYDSASSVPNETFIMTNASGNYIWRNQSFSESAFGSYSFYANITGTTNIGMAESSLANYYGYSVKGIFITEALNSSTTNTGDIVNVSGKAILLPEGINVTNNLVKIWLDGVLQNAVGLWKFDESTGNDSADSSGFGNNGTYYGENFSTGTYYGEAINNGILMNFDFNASSGWTTGNISGGLEFDGVDDYVNASAVNISASGTVTARVYPASESTSTQTIVMASGTPNRIYLYRNATDGYFTIRLGSMALTSGITTTVLPLNVWSSVALSWNGTNFTAYVNGTQVLTGGYTGLSDVGSCVAIGAYSPCTAAGQSAFFNGTIDNVRTYNRTLSAAEILQIYQNNTMIRDGLAGYWRFDESAGTTAYDTHHIAYSSNPNATKFGNAMAFDGVNDYIDAGNSTSQSINAITIGAWIYRVGNATHSGLVSRDTYADPKTRGYLLNLRSNGSLRFEIYGDDSGTGNGTILDGSTVVSFNQWTYVSAVWNGSIMKLFVNGVEDPNTGTYTGTINPNITKKNIIIGALKDGAQFYFNGSIDDVRIYNKSLSEAEVAQIYQNNTMIRDGLLGYWRFDESHGITEHDTHHIAAAQNQYSTKSGNAITFDGVGDYVDAGNSSNLNFDNMSAFSVFAWIKTAGDSNMAIVSKRINNRGYELVIPSTNGSILRALLLNDNANNNIYKDGSVPINNNQWHFVGFTYNGSGNAADVKMYVDGSEDANANNTKNNLTGTIQSAASFQIGARQAAIPFNGTIDDVRVYSRALSASEILALYSGTINSYTTTDASGNYNQTIIAPLTAGNYTVKVNMTDANGISGSNQTNLSVRINLTSPNAKGMATGTTIVNVGEAMNVSINIPASNINYPIVALSNVWVNVSNSTWSYVYFLTGNVSGGVWWNATFSSSAPSQYNVTYYANLTDGFAITAAANTTFNVKQLNITYAINDTMIYSTETSKINGTIYLEPEHALSGTTPINITLNSGSTDAGGKITDASGRYNFTYTPAAITSITTMNFTLNATNTTIGINGTAVNSSAITAYPPIAVDTWASTTSACSDRASALNTTAAKYLCANITYGTNNTAGAYVNFSVSDIGSYAYGAANPVFTNNSLYDTGAIVSSPVSLNESTKYRITATAWNPSINALITASDTYDFNYGLLNISANLTDYAAMPDTTITITGNISDYHNSTWTRAYSFIRIALDGTELTNGGHYNKAWATNAEFSNGTSVNITNSSNLLVLDQRGQYYFEAENYLASGNFTNETNSGSSGNKRISSSDLPAWANYNITGIPNGTYYISMKLESAAAKMVNVTWDGAFVNTTQRPGYPGGILWSDNLGTSVTINSTSHILGINSTTDYPIIDVLILTTNSSYTLNDTDQNYTSTPLKYRGYFASNKTTADYAIISITPNWASNEPAGSNITIDISADNGASWCPNITKHEYRANESCGGIGVGTELVWRANFSTNNPFAALRLSNMSLLYETGNATKTNSSGLFGFSFNALNALGWHNISINATDSDGIYGNLTMQYFLDNITIAANTTPELIDADTISQTINVTILSNGGRTSGTRKNITVTMVNPDSTQDTISNSSFACTNNYPMNCTATWAPAAQPFGYYNITVAFEDNESITGTNTTYNDFKVDNITTTIAPSESAPILPKNITVSGTAQTYASSVLNAANITIATSTETHYCGYNTSMSGASYDWSKMCSLNVSEYSDELGPATITVKINDTTGSIAGINSTSIAIWAPAIVNYTNTTNYSGTNTEYNITGRYWRTDILGAIPGTINITIFNSTYNITKSCSGASSCLKNFSVGPAGELIGGNYTVWINASNDSAYYMQNSTAYSMYLEEPKATGALNAENKIISDMVFGTDYSYNATIVLNNTYRASMYGAEIRNYSSCSNIKAINNLTPSTCQNTQYSSSCPVVFNITISGTACMTPPCDISCILWNSSWANNDNSASSATKDDYTIHISGNPDIGASISSINITDNIGSPNITQAIVSNTGNEILGTFGSYANSVFVDLVNSTIPSSWITFSSTETWSAPNYWDYIPVTGGSYPLDINTTASNYTPGTYAGILNITARSATAGLQAYVEINISITISPNISISQNLANITQFVGSPNITNITIQSNGNSPITNVTATYISESMPASWISITSPDPAWNASSNAFNRITEYTNKTFSANITALSYAPGTYTGKINITTNENLGRLINVTLAISPAISANLSKINITQNISSANTTLVLINSAGNAPLTNVTITLVNSTIPQSWVSLNSEAGDWNSGAQSFSRIEETTNRTLNITVKAANYTEGTYTGILNITSNESQNTQINLSIAIAPAAATYGVNKAAEHNTTFALYHIVNSTGNAPLINTTSTYIEGSLPASWITLNYSGQSGQTIILGNITEGDYKNATIGITVPQFQEPGSYAGYINTTFDNEPTQQMAVSITVNTNSSWHILPPENKSNVFVLGDSPLDERGVIGNVTIVNTGNIPLNYTVLYAKNPVCNGYTCMSGAPAQYNPSYAYVAKNSSQTFGVWQKGSSSTQTGAQIIVNISNSSGTPAESLAYMSWNITNAPPVLVNLTTLPKNYVELNKSIILYSIISDDEVLATDMGLNLTSVYFNATNPAGYTYTIDNESIYTWSASPVPPEADRRKFNYSFANTSLAGMHNLTIYIKDKSGNEINHTIFQFEVIGATSANISAANPPAAANVTILHGENLTVPINITNFGRATAYNITLTGTFGATAENWTVWNATISQLNESQNLSLNLTITVANWTLPNSYQFTPKIIWAQPNASQAENITAANVTVTVSSNPEIMLPAEVFVSMNHSEQKSTTIYANSTGNAIYGSSSRAYVINGSAPLNWTCVGGNYCGSGGTYVELLGGTPINTSRPINVFIGVPAGTSPGNYTTSIKMNSTINAGKTANITITVLADRSWYYSQPYNASDFELNTPGIAGIITLNGSGNIETNFTISYNNWSDTDYHTYPGLFNESQNNSGTIVNPTSVTLQPNEIKNITIYHNGYNAGLANIGINVTLSNSSASPAVQSIAYLFNLTETPPNITGITFFNASYAELNKTIGIKIQARDDASLNLSTILLNITTPLGATITAAPDTTQENQTAYGKYIKMNFTYLFNSTQTAGNYTVNASIRDEYGGSGYSAVSSQYVFEVVGITAANLSSNATAYNVSGISQAADKNLTIYLNATNTGWATAYDAALSGNFSSNASSWQAYGNALGNISASSNVSGNITLHIPERTWPGTYYFTPSIAWAQPNGSAGEYYSSPYSITVSSNRSVIFSEYALNYTIIHGTTNSTIIRINSTGNDNATSIILWKQNVPSNLTVSLNQTTISSIAAGESSDVALNITPVSGAPNNTYAFGIRLDNDGSTVTTYSYSVIIPASFTWNKNRNTTIVNGVSGQNAIDTSINITNTGNNPITYTFNLAGNVTNAPPIMELTASQKTLQPLETYAIPLNHTARNENKYYEGQLEIWGNETYWETVAISYNSYIAEFNITDISPNNGVIAGNPLNITTQILFGGNNITENTTYGIYINGTACAITQNATNGGYVIHTCIAPPISDGSYYSLSVNADYQFTTGIVPMSASNSSAIYYADVTIPRILSHSITAEQEILKNITINTTLSDNIMLDTAIAEILFPNGTAYANITLSNTTASNYSAVFAAPSAFGIYSARYYVNDTTGNVNSSIADSFEIYEWKNFSGVMQDLNLNTITVSFNVTNSSGSAIAYFQTNSSGNYNATLKKKTYNLEMSFLNSTIQLSDVNFAGLSSDFIDIDQPIVGDYGYEGNVLKGFAINTSLDSSGTITITYNAAEASTYLTNYFQIYRCVSWDYGLRNCDNGLSKLTSTHDKINRKLSATFTEMGAFLLVEDLPKDRPEMTIPASLILGNGEHGKTNTTYLTVQSSGSLAITKIEFTCISGAACTSFNVSARTILGFDAGATYDEPINISVPKYYAPGTYEGVFEAISNRGSVYEQVIDVNLRVIVAEDNNWTAQSNLTLEGVGGGGNGEFAQFTLRNDANVPVFFIISPNTPYIAADPEEILIAKNSSGQIAFNYTAPQSVGFYNYSINITGTGTDITKEIEAYAAMNVTHAINITEIIPSENISVGQNMLINATASYLEALQTSNVSWAVFLDETPCDNSTYSYNSTNWVILCKAPNMSAKLSYTLRLKGTFENYGGLVAYASAYDLANVYYVDTIPPRIINTTGSVEETAENTTINITLEDYSNITNITVSVFMPNGTLAGVFAPEAVGNKTYSLAYNFSEIGDYLLRYSLTDSLNNGGAEDKYFEVYRNMAFSGKVEKSNSSGTWTTFKLYRPNQSFSEANKIHEFSSGASGANEGKYNQTIHSRQYDVEIEVNGENNKKDIIKLYGVNLTNYSIDPIDIDFVSANNAQIENANELHGIAVNTNITSSGRIALYYSPSASTYEDNIYVYKCANWNFTKSRCEGTWSKLDRDANDLDTSNDKISLDISGFSAYLAAEATQPITVDITGTVSVTTTGGSGGGGSSKDYTSTLSEMKQKIVSLLEGTSDFSVDTKSISKQLYPGERVNVAIGVKNALNESVRMSARAIGEFANFTTFGSSYLDLIPQESRTFSLEIFIPKNAYPGNYEGKIIINNGKADNIVPVSLRILDTKNLPISIDVQPLVDDLAPGANERVKLGIINTGSNEMLLNYTVSLIDPITGLTILEVNGNTLAISSESIYVNFTIPENITLETPEYDGLKNVRTKRYMIKATAYSTDPNNELKAESVSFISVTESMSVWKVTYLGIPLWLIIEAMLISITGYTVRKRYLIWANSKKKYAETIDFKSLPQVSLRSAFIGKIAETDIRTFLDLDTLQMHTIVAGSTGGGKTVAAQIIVEEALLKGTAVVVFDPTAQWSGFLRPNRDKKMLKTYGRFDMKVADSRAFHGNIREITDAHEVVDVTKYMNPGEITIFTMNHMDTKDIDFFVANTVKQVFHAGLEGAQKLKLLMVYDEVHRLLAKYGGTGDGFIQLERGVREFRKWGIGLVLISQVLSDFIGTIKANIGTEIQVRSRDESDLERIKMKYGEDMMRSIVKAAVGEGLLQNAQYNKGRPYFVAFRPLLHATERISDDELKKYGKYNTKIDDLKYQLECLKAEAFDVFDVELELKLTAENLMKGKFNMVDIYLDELEPKVASIWKKLGKEPKKRVIAYASEEEIQKDVERAKREREDYIKMQQLAESKAKAAAPAKSGEPASAASAQATTAAPAAQNQKSEKEAKDADEGKTGGAPIEEAAKPQKWMNAREHKKQLHIHKAHDKEYHASIKQAVIGDIRRRAKEEDARAGILARHAEKAPEQEQEPQKGKNGKDIKETERELNGLYEQLKEKIAECKNNGKDVSVASLKSMTIPSDIKLAAADESPKDMEKIRNKIDALMKNL